MAYIRRAVARVRLDDPTVSIGPPGLKFSARLKRKREAVRGGPAGVHVAKGTIRRTTSRTPGQNYSRVEDLPPVQRRLTEEQLRRQR